MRVRALVRVRVLRVSARVCLVNWGGRWKSGEECKRKWGGGEGKGGMRDGRGVDSEVKMEEGLSEEESPNRKEEGLVLRKGERGGKREGLFPEKIARNRI